MKSILRLVLLATSLCLISTSTLTAAPADHPRAKVGAKLKERAAFRHHAAKKLGLSPEQIAALKAERANTIATLKSLRNDASLTKDQKRAKAKEALQGARSKAQSVLTPDQQAKAKKLRAKHFKHRNRQKQG